MIYENASTRSNTRIAFRSSINITLCPVVHMGLPDDLFNNRCIWMVNDNFEELQNTKIYDGMELE
jgi:hypothetical protein